MTRKVYTKVYDLTGLIVCDSCDADHATTSAPGGILFESKAICPACAPKWEEGAKKHGEAHFIRDRAREGESFRDFVLRLRAGYPGAEGNRMVVTGDDAWHAAAIERHRARGVTLKEVG